MMSGARKHDKIVIYEYAAHERRFHAMLPC